MPAIGFTVFKDKILDGTKTQTIRKYRKFPIKVGSVLYIYWHLRQKDCKHLLTTTCTEIITIQMQQEPWLGKQRLLLFKFEHELPWIRLTPEETQEIVLKDGFKTEDEMLKWFTEKYRLPEVFQVIRWAMPAIVSPNK